MGLDLEVLEYLQHPPQHQIEALSPNVMLNLYAIYARNGTINILLPFTDLLRNVRPYVVRPASFSSHLLL